MTAKAGKVWQGKEKVSLETALTVLETVNMAGRAGKADKTFFK